MNHHPRVVKAGTLYQPQKYHVTKRVISLFKTLLKIVFVAKHSLSVTRFWPFSQFDKNVFNALCCATLAV